MAGLAGFLLVLCSHLALNASTGATGVISRTSRVEVFGNNEMITFRFRESGGDLVLNFLRPTPLVYGGLRCLRPAHVLVRTRACVLECTSKVFLSQAACEAPYSGYS